MGGSRSDLVKAEGNGDGGWMGDLLSVNIRLRPMTLSCSSSG